MKQITINNFGSLDNIYPTKRLLNRAFAKMDYHSRKQAKKKPHDTPLSFFIYMLTLLNLVFYG